MKVVFYVGPNSNLKVYRPALQCALARANCEVVSICPVSFYNETHIDCVPEINKIESKYPFFYSAYISGDKWAPKTETGLITVNRHCFLRWMILGVLLEDRITSPIMFLDWDVLVAHDMEEAYHQVSGYDLTCSVNPMHITKSSILADFSSYMEDTAKDGVLFTNDMHAWLEFFRKRPGTNRLDCITNPRPIYFDCSMHMNTETFEPDSEIVHEGLLAKKLVWEGNKPYFILKETQEHYPAYIIHCWGKYKHMINEVANKIMS